MPYTPSEPRRHWAGERSPRLDVIGRGHALVVEHKVSDAPRDAGRPLVHAFVIGMLSEFQGFVRDLHAVAVELIVTASGASPRFSPILSDGMTAGRGLDRGNATTATIKSDFRKIGISPLDLASHNSQWALGDAAVFEGLVRMRNALGHGNDNQRRYLVAAGAAEETFAWARSRLPLLDRYVEALDMSVWDHLERIVETEPWT